MTTRPPDRRADDLASRVTDRLVEPLAALGLDVEAVEISRAGRRRMLRVAVDADGGVDLDAVAEASRTVSEVLGDDVMGAEPWTLEVTSRGVDRPLTAPRHWRRNAGRLVKVTFTDDRDPLTGRVVDHDEDEAGGVRLRVPGGSQDPVEVAYADISGARVQVELNRKED